jgi:hypothetical protein
MAEQLSSIGTPYDLPSLSGYMLNEIINLTIFEPTISKTDVEKRIMKRFNYH